jgi:hypothetical protein
MTLSILFSAAALVLSGFSFLFFRSYLKRRTGRERILGEFRDEIDKLIAEIDGAADRDAALVEERIKSLRALLEDTDKRIALYTRELERRQSQESAYRELGKNRFRPAEPPVPEPAVPEAVVPEAPASGQEKALPPSGAPPASPPVPAEPSHGPALKPEPPSRPRFVRAPQGIAPKPPPFAEQVAELYREGFSAELIASRLGAALAEVDLAIAILESRGFS